MRRCLALSVLALVACQAPPEVEPEAPQVLVPPLDRAAPAGATSAPKRAKVGVALGMKRLRFAEGALELSITDRDHDVHPWDEGGVLTQWVRLDDDHALSIVVRAGRGESLEGFRRDHPHHQLSDEEATTVCGRPARRLVARRAEEPIECTEFSDGRPSAPG